MLENFCANVPNEQWLCTCVINLDNCEMRTSRQNINSFFSRRCPRGRCRRCLVSLFVSTITTTQFITEILFMNFFLISCFHCPFSLTFLLISLNINSAFYFEFSLFYSRHFIVSMHCDAVYLRPGLLLFHKHYVDRAKT